LTANLRVDLKTKYPGISVSTVMPGIVDTDFQKVAGSPFPVKAGSTLGPQRVQSAEEVARQIVSLIDNPVAELYTNPAASELAQQYFRDVALFEENMLRRRPGN
jgi:short-subunit dehydrogenase